MRKTVLTCVLLAMLACTAFADYSVDPAVYGKFIFFKDYVIYAQAEGNSMRFAPTPEALKDAQPIVGVPEDKGIAFKDVRFPLPAEAIPEGITVLGQFYFRPGRTKDKEGKIHNIIVTHGKVWLTKTDEQGVNWTCILRAGAGVDKNMVPELEKAPEVQVNLLQGLTLNTTAITAGRAVKIGLALSSGALPMDSIRRDGKPAAVHVSVIDAEGNAVESKTGTLNDFGFS